MAKRMLIDANHPEETRAVVLDDRHLVDFGIRERVLAQQRKERGEEQIKRPEIPAVRFCRIEPARVVGQQHAFQVAAFLHLQTRNFA